MKKIALFIVASSLAFAVNAQDGKTKTSATTPAPTTTAVDKMDTSDGNTKPHVCTAACKKVSGVHVYVHGEKGHTCTDACKRAAVAPAPTPVKK